MSNSYWVIRGSFAAGEYPGAKDPIEAASKLSAEEDRYEFMLTICPLVVLGAPAPR